MATDTEISTMLQRYATGLDQKLQADGSAPPVLDLTAAPHRRGRGRVLVAAALVAFVAAVAGLVLVNRPPSGGTGQWATLPPSPLGQLVRSEATWTGSQFVVMGLESIDTSETTETTTSADAPATVGRPEPTVVATYDPATDQWTRLPNPPIPAGGFPVLVRGPGRITVLFSDNGVGDCTKAPDPARAVGAWWDETAATWRDLAQPDFGIPVSCGVSAVRVDGVVYVFSDNSYAYPGTSSGAFDEATGTWRAVAKAPFYAQALLPVGGQIYEFRPTLDGVVYGDGPPSGAARYDIATDTWSDIPFPPVNPGISTTVGSQVFVWDGTAGALLDPSTDQWTATPPSPTGIHLWTSVGSLGDDVVVWGGTGASTGFPSDPNSRQFKSSGALLDPGTMTWSKLSSSPLSPRAGALVATSPDALFLYGGYDGDSQLTDGAVLRASS